MRTIAAVFALMFVVAAPAAAQPTAAELARAPVYSYPALSLSGRYASFLVTDDGGRNLKVFDLEAGGGAILTADLADDDVRGFDWVGDSYLIFGRRNQPKSLANVGDGVLRRPHGFSLAVLNIAERTLRSPLKENYPAYAGRYGQGYFRNQDEVRHVFGDGPNILMELHESKRRSGELAQPTVYRVNLATNETEIVENPENDVYAWGADRQGRVRLAYEQGDNSVDLRILDIESGDWRSVGSRYASPLSRFAPLGFAEDPHTLYVVSNHEGEPGGLYPYDTRTGQFGAAIASHPVFEIQGVQLDRNTGEVLAAVAGDLIIPVAPEERAYYDLVAENFPGKRTGVVGMSRDRSVRVVAVSDSDDPGGYYVYRSATGAFDLFGRRMPWLDSKPLAAAQETSYAARDGLTIQAFLTTPPGVAAQNLPFVVFPHGGPDGRDSSYWDPMVQLLAAQGYGVLQMNFRGSEGFGKAYEELGAGQWGKAMQDDVVDGANWLVSQGYADPDRICIVGWSYGGYAALIGASRDADTFACAASIAGVTDLEKIIRYVDNSVLTRRIGETWRDRASLREHSPVNLAKEMAIPIFIVHGQLDGRVPFSHALEFMRAMERRKKPPENLAFPLGDHSLDNPAFRERLYVRLTEFLNTHIGG